MILKDFLSYEARKMAIDSAGGSHEFLSSLLSTESKYSLNVSLLIKN